MLGGYTSWGVQHKQLMKFGPLHARVAGSQLVHEDLPQADNRIDLDPDVRDFLGTPAARITYSPHRHEQVAAVVLGARVEAYQAAAPGAIGSAILPFPILDDGPIYTAHLAGTARMGEDPGTSVTDASGRLHEVDNVYVADASTFPTFPGFNPTLTIMANALRVCRGIACGSAAGPPDGTAAEPAPAPSPGRPDQRRDLPATGPGQAVRVLPLAATAAGAAALAARKRVDAPVEGEEG
jgi:choline dehydrogenase-like flavoprotein